MKEKQSHDKPKVCAAFYHACEKLLRHFGNGPYDDLRVIGELDGQGWAIVANITRSRETIKGIDFGFIFIHRNGMTVGAMTPDGGWMIGENSETDFISWCLEDHLQTLPAIAVGQADL